MATLGIIGCHVAGDFFLGIDILVTSMLVNFLLMAMSVLTLPARNAALAREVTVLPSRAAQVPLALVAVVVLAAFLGRSHVEGPDRARHRVVPPLDAAVAPGDGRRLAHLSSAKRRSCAARAWTSTRGSRRFLPDRLMTLDRGSRSRSPPISPFPACSRGSGKSPTWSATAVRSTPSPTARALRAYVDAGFTSFDMADHYGSAEIVASHLREGSAEVQLFTKWVPKPGPLSLGDARAAVERSLQRLRARRIDLLQFHAWSYADPSWIDGLLYLAGAQVRGIDRAHRPDERGRGASQHGARHGHRGGFEPGLLLAARSARGRVAVGRVPCARRQAARLRNARRRLAVESMARSARARLGTQRHLVADEVRPLHARRRRVGCSAASAARRGCGGASARRVDRQRGLPLRPRAAGRGRHHHRRPARRARAHRRQPSRLFLFVDRTRIARSWRPRSPLSTRFPATAATSTASRRFSRRPAI